VVAGRGRGPSELQLSFTLLYHRTGVTGPLVMVEMVLVCGCGSLEVLGPSYWTP